MLDGHGMVRLDGGGTVSAQAAALPPGSRVVVCLRPEHLRFASDTHSGGIPAVLEGSASLGASRLYTLRRVVLPLVRPGILAGGFICFMVSFDNIPVSLFLRDAATDMLPIRMWQDLEGKLDVTIAALSGVLIVATVAVMLLMERLVGLSRRLT
jgi:ABC-type spermidine/putrescine transport system permease subunit II